MRKKQDGGYGIADDGLAYYETLSERTQGLPATVLVLAAQKMAFKEVL